MTKQKLWTLPVTYQLENLRNYLKVNYIQNSVDWK